MKQVKRFAISLKYSTKWHFFKAVEDWKKPGVLDNWNKNFAGIRVTDRVTKKVVFEEVK